MGIKENIKAVRDELTTEEQFLEGMIKTERFFKAKKRYIVGALILAVIGTAGYGINSMMEQNRLKSSNDALVVLLKDPQNVNALETLKQKNEKLYEIFVLQQAIEKTDNDALSKLSKSKTSLVSDIAGYQLAQTEETAVVKSELMSGLAALQVGYALLKENKIDEAKLQFATIEPTSALKQIAQNLEHYQGLK